MKSLRYTSARKIFRFGYIAALLVMLLLAFLSYYGQNAGNFVMTVDEKAYDRGVAISDNIDDGAWQRWLTASAVDDVRDYTYKAVEDDFVEILNSNGDFGGTENHYLAYTFYVKNVGVEVTNVYYRINIAKETKDLSKAIRVLIIEDGYVKYDEYNNPEITYESMKMYQAPDEQDITYDDNLSKAINFESDRIVCTNVVEGLRPDLNEGENNVRKITFVMWIEGEDPECIGDANDVFGGIYGSAIKLELNLRVDPFQ